VNTRRWFLIIGWFALAAFVIVRGIQLSTSWAELIVLFVAWLGGVVSLACVEIAVDGYRLRKARKAVAPTSL
jgi:hypothetical protein